MKYKQSLEYFYNINMLNEKGLKEYIKILRDELIKVKIKWGEL